MQRGEHANRNAVDAALRIFETTAQRALGRHLSAARESSHPSLRKSFRSTSFRPAFSGLQAKTEGGVCQLRSVIARPLRAQLSNP
jgi:hypothetical protein